MKKYTILIVVCFTFVFAQKEDAQKLLFSTEMSAFGANLEYFNGFRPGELLLLTTLKSSFQYSFTNQISTKAGVLLQRTIADESGISLARPLFQIRYSKGGFSLFIGDIYSDERHRLPDAIIQTESKQCDSFEEGIRFLYDYPAVYGDLWLSYLALNTKEHLEHLNLGLYVESPSRAVQAKGGLLWDHYGGQLHSVEGDYMRDTLNLFASLSLKKKVPQRTFIWGGELGIFGSSVTKSRSREAYQRGYGGYGTLYCNVNRFIFSALLFQGDNYQTSRGNKLYESPDTYYFLQVERAQKIAENIHIDWGVRFEFVGIHPKEYFKETEYKAWVGIHSGFSKQLFPFRRGII